MLGEGLGGVVPCRTASWRIALTFMDAICCLAGGAKGIQRLTWPSTTWVGVNEHGQFMVRYTGLHGDDKGERQEDFFVLSLDDFSRTDWRAVPA